MIIVDDNSPDGTGEVAEKLSRSYPVHVIHRAGKLGLGSAVMEGFLYSNRDYFGVMDADLSHDPAIIPELTMLLNKFDIVIGSRFAPSSFVEDWALNRKLLSKTGIFLAKFLTHVKDPLSGYFFLHRRVISGLKLTSSGYKILFEILVKGHYKNVKEVSFKFRGRQHNMSKLNMNEYLLFLKQIIYFFFRRMIGK